MKLSSTPHDYFESFKTLSPARASAEPAWLSQQRRAALDLLQTGDIPSRRSESWRYASAQRLFEKPFVPATTAVPEVAAEDIHGIPGAGHDAIRIVLANGHLVAAASLLEDLPAGVRIAGLQQVLSDPAGGFRARPGQLIDPVRNVFSAMNAAGLSDGLVLEVDDGVVLQRPIEVLHLCVATEQATLIQPRNLIRLGRDAAASVVEHYMGSADSRYFCNAVTEVSLEEGADLNHLQLQRQGPRAFHLCTEAVQQATASRYTGTRIALGGGWARNEIDIRFDGERASADLAGTFCVGDAQLNDVHLDVRHAVPACSSQALFKGLLHGRGRGVLDGRIVVDRQAQQSEAHLNSANLLLAREAEIDAKPILEIYADEVQCSHGATVGQLDPAHVFYLRSRGIDRANAERLLALGFAREVLERCPYPALGELIDRELQQRFSNTPEAAPGGQR